MGKAELFNLSNEKALATPKEALRTQLTMLEQVVGSLSHCDAAAALDLPMLFDRVAALLVALSVRGTEVAAEQTRFDAVSAQFRNKSALFLECAGGSAALRSRREAVQPDELAWWWWVDLQLDTKRRHNKYRRWRWGIAAVVLLAVLGLVYARFLAPDPTARAIYNHQFNAMDLAAIGDYVAALEETELALALAPANPELLTLRAVLLAALGDVSALEASVAAEEAFDNREDYLATRGQLQMRAGQLEAAQDTAEALLTLNERSAIGYLYRGMAAEGLGDQVQARADYERAGALAQEQQLHHVYVTSRNLLANLSTQRGP